MSRVIPPRGPVDIAAESAAASQASGRNLANSAVVLLLTRLIGVAVAWSLEIVLVRVLGHDEWDSMSRFLTLVTAFTIAQLGFPESVLYFTAKSGSSGAGLRLAARTSVLLGTTGLLLSIPFGIFPWLTEWLLGASDEDIWLPLLIFVTADLAFSPLPSLLLGRNRPRLAAILSVGTRLPIAFSVLVAILSGLGLQGAMYGMAAGGVLSLAVGWLVVISVLRDSGTTGQVARLRDQLTFSIPVGVTRFVQIGNVKLDKYIVMTVFTEGVYGTYYLGAAEFPVPGMICSAVMTVMMARLVGEADKSDRTGFLRLWHGSVEKIALVVLPVFTFLMVFAEAIFVALYGDAHAEAAIQFRIFQLLLLARITNFTNLFLALGKPRVPLVAAGIALTLNAGLSVLLIQVLGILGPAVGNVTAIYLSTIYTMWALKVALRVPWRELLPLAKYLRTLGIAAIAVVPASAVLALGVEPWLEVATGAVVHVVCYLLLGHVAGIVTTEDRRFLMGIITMRFLSERQDRGADP